MQCQIRLPKLALEFGNEGLTSIRPLILNQQAEGAVSDSLAALLTVTADEIEAAIAMAHWPGVKSGRASLQNTIEYAAADQLMEAARTEPITASSWLANLETFVPTYQSISLSNFSEIHDVADSQKQVPCLADVELSEADFAARSGGTIVAAVLDAVTTDAEIEFSGGNGLTLTDSEIRSDGVPVARFSHPDGQHFQLQPYSMATAEQLSDILEAVEYVVPAQSQIGLAHAASLTVLSDRGGRLEFSSAIVFNDASANPDVDTDFDANDSFLIHLVKLSGTDTQIEQSKGSSPLSSTKIRAVAMGLNVAGDVGSDQDFDANDSFLTHLVKLSGTNAQIEQSEGTNPLSAAEIRTNVNNLGGGTTASAAGAQVL